MAICLVDGYDSNYGAVDTIRIKAFSTYVMYVLNDYLTAHSSCTTNYHAYFGTFRVQNWSIIRGALSSCTYIRKNSKSATSSLDVDVQALFKVSLCLK